MNNIKNNALRINLKFTTNNIEVNAKISFYEPLKEIDFILNNSMKINKIENNDHIIQWEKMGECKPEFKVNSQKIKITSMFPINDFILSYYGTINGWYNILTNEIKALSSYSVWFPQEFPFKITSDEVIVENGENLVIVKGIYDSIKKTWYYGGKGFDPFNIIAYDKNMIKMNSNKYLNIYYIENSIEKNIKKVEKIYSDVLEFYNGQLFKSQEIPVLDIACVSPALKTGGGYQRKGFMFTTDFGEDDLYIIRLLAHETAHNWCFGANISSWEDWLNETTAEWAFLLFLNSYDIELFKLCIDQKLKNNEIYPAIKTIDGKRPQGVHEKGTMLFYEIFQTFGKDIITKLVRGFSNLNIKNTENFIKMIELEIGIEVVQKIIRGIE